jgi:chromosome segregation protein
MLLSKLQILGFKSFPQKTELRFDRGITAIVGPNGCGKTNLLDSIRWVLGEQRTTLLRSSKMEDVIFNGTKDLKPLGMAEVTLVIDNHKSILPTDYNQVTVTRRLFRSGESEYLLNKTPCRLKDITELFLDTGVGIHAYSVIQPEMVEAILSDRAEERRFLFEEAAGITKYKLRKKEAERKLEHTENDLLRLGDILSEVEKQVNSLRRQRGKAERYKRLSEEIRNLEIKLGRNEFRILKAREKELQEKIKVSTDRSQHAASDLDQEEARIESLKLQMLKADKELVEIQKTVNRLSETNFQIEREISVNRERKSNLEKLISKNQEEMENLKSRRSSIAEERDQKRRQLEELAAEIGSKERECQAEDEELISSDGQLQQVKARLQEHSQKWQEANDLLNRLDSEKESSRAQIRELTEREAELTEETRKLSEEIGAVSQALSGLTSEEQERRKLRQAITEKAQSVKEELEQNRNDLTQLAAEEIELRSVLEGDKAGLHMLEQICEHYEGYGEGERWVLSARDKLPGIIDTVANLISAPGEYVRAIESALGEAAQFIVCQDTESAKSAIAHLKDEKAGRATFLPMDRVDAWETESQPVELGAYQGVVGKASDLVQCDPKFVKVSQVLLGSVILVETLDQALELASTVQPDFDLVTLNGELVKAQVVLSGGSSTQVSLLGRELEIRKLKERIDEQSRRLRQITDEKNQRQAQQRSLQEELAQVSAENEKAVQRLQQSEVQLKTVEFEKSSLEKRNSELQELVGQTRQMMEDTRRKSERRNQRLQELSQEKLRLSSMLDKEKQILEEAEASHTETFKRANQLKIELVSLQGRKEQIESDLTRLSELIREIQSTLESKARESRDSLSEIEELSRTNARKQDELKRAFEDIEGYKAQLSAKTGEHADRQADLDLKEKNLKAARQTKERFLDDLHQLRMEQVELSSKTRSVQDRILEEYQVNLEEAGEVEDLSEVEIEKSREALGQTKEKLKALGAVNLLALEEYESSKQRLDFLQNQVRDLTEAKETLTSAILKINQTARELFTETFEKTRLNFQKVFEELFEGGETELRLEESGDPLESPIRISARPYGKRLLSISQLSGGEKALTAIALLFAIYLVKPSPFCILDEVDAPLDDANIGRFLKLIKHFSSNTQFIVITHNKLTMESADVLYGVTMEQPGVSKIVSVKFDKHELVTEASPDTV